MKHRHQGRPLPAGGHIGAAEIGHHRNPQSPGQPLAVADLPSPPFGRSVQDGVTVETDHIHFGRRQPGHRQQLTDHLGMHGGQFPLDLAHRADAAQNPPQTLPEVGAIGDGHGGTQPFNGDAVGHNHGGINPIQRGSAHQADSKHGH